MIDKFPTVYKCFWKGKNTMKKKFVMKAKVVYDGTELVLRVNNYTLLATSRRSVMNNALKLKHDDKVRIIVEKLR